MKITLRLAPSTVEEIRSILTTYLAGGQVTPGDIEAAMAVLSYMLRKLPSPKTKPRARRRVKTSR